MSEFPSEFSKMSSVTEAMLLVRSIGTSREGPIKTRIAYASRRLGWLYSRTKNVWYSNARRIDAAEIDQLRKVALGAERERAVSAVVALRAQLAETNPHLHGEAVDALDTALRSLGFEICTEE
jgi:predicted alpha/beta-hydrolase family hydrolase